MRTTSNWAVDLCVGALALVMLGGCGMPASDKSISEQAPLAGSPDEGADPANPASLPGVSAPATSHEPWATDDPGTHTSSINPENSTPQRFESAEDPSVDLAFWRSLSFDANWIDGRPSFLTQQEWSDLSIIATVESVHPGEPTELGHPGIELTFVDITLRVVVALKGASAETVVLRMETPGSLTAMSDEANRDWYQSFGQALPTGPAYFALRVVDPGNPTSSYRVLSDRSIWVEDSGLTTGFDPLPIDWDWNHGYLAIADRVGDLEGLADLLARPDALRRLEDEIGIPTPGDLSVFEDSVP